MRVTKCNLKTRIYDVPKKLTHCCISVSGSPNWVTEIKILGSIQSQLLPGFTPGIFVKLCTADRKNKKYKGGKRYLNRGESKAVFGNNDTPIGRNDSTCRNVFSLCLNDSRHAALPIGFTLVCRHRACTCTHEHTPVPSILNHT